MFTELDATVEESAILATNTSGFAIGDVNKAVSAGTGSSASTGSAPHSS